jgi:hypothetical protein
MSSLGLFLVFLAVIGIPLAALVAVLARGVSVRFALDIAHDTPVTPVTPVTPEQTETAPQPVTPRKRIDTGYAPRAKGKGKGAQSKQADPAQPYTAPHHADTQHPHALGTWGTETAPHGHSTHATHSTDTGNAGGNE